MQKLLCGALALACLASASVPASAMGATNWLSSPAATTAAKNAASLANSVVCVIASTASVAADVENAINAGKAKLLVRTGATITVQAASAALCADLRGVVQAVAAPAP